jgi:tmRNA-binding protein
MAEQKGKQKREEKSFVAVNKKARHNYELLDHYEVLC